MSAVALQQSLRHLQAAFRNFFNKTADYPRFKAKRDGGSATFASSAFTWKPESRELTLAKMAEPLPIRWSRTIPRRCAPSSVTVSLDPAGRWHVSILVEEAVKSMPEDGGQVGIDMGWSTSPSPATGRKSTTRGT